MRLLAAVIALILAATAVQAGNHSTHGRTVGEVVVIRTLPEYERYQWPGIYFETRFKGRHLGVYLGDSHNRYKLMIDNDPAVVIDCGTSMCRQNQAASAIKLKKGGWHTVRLEKIGESQDDSGSFWGFDAVNGQLSPLPPRTRQIEFIGDSSTVGYGNTSPKRECSDEDLRLTTDTSQAFGPLTAKHFNADYQINAISGRGVVRNYDGVAPGKPLPALYPYVLFDQDMEYDDPSWQPQLIVIGLGGNDFSTPLKPGETWKTEAELAADFEAAYIAFLKDLRARHPKALLLVTAYDGPEVSQHVNAVVAGMKSGGETRIDTVTLGGFALTGCHWHLDLTDHNRIRDQLIGWIDAHPDIWSST